MVLCPGISCTTCISTTFVLDLNTALAQVLSQKQHTLNGNTTYFLPGTGAQQTQGAWTYLHTDALGSIRQMTNPVGQVVGGMRYTPFGEIIEQTGVVSPRGYTGEFQNPVNNLTYLRARYYDPKIGRFLTQDSIIPDLLNGQAWNAYAYVYNDTINLVDPSGHDAISAIAPFLPAHTKDRLYREAQFGLKVLDWWQSKPDDCECNQENASYIDWAQNVSQYGATPLAQLALARATQPVKIIGTGVFQSGVHTSAGINIPTLTVMQHNQDFSLYPLAGPRSHTSFNGARSVVTHADDGYFIRGPGGLMRARNLSVVGLDGIRGYKGSILGGGFIDALFQLGEDLFITNLCLSPAQFFMRALTALSFGLVAALVGTAATAIAIPILGAGLGATLIGFGVSLVVGWRLTPWKNKLLDGVANAY